jgi:hypothetical protein
MTLLNQANTRVLARGLSPDRLELIVVIAFEDGPPADYSSGDLELIDRQPLEHVAPPELMLIPVAIPDSTLGSPRPTRWQSIEIDKELGAYVTYSRGVHEALHHVEVDERASQILITLFLGLRAEFAGRGSHMIAPVAILERAAVPFEGDLFGRAIADGGQT